MDMDGKAHNPGPWHFDGPPDNHIVWASPESRICFMAHSNGIDPERDTANAALVAAAPELLEALQLADAFLRGAHIDMSVLERKTTAAIAKAMTHPYRPKGESV